MRSRPVPGWVLFFLCSSSSSSPPAPPPLHTLHRLLPWCLYRGREGEGGGREPAALKRVHGGRELEQAIRAPKKQKQEGNIRVRSRPVPGWVLFLLCSSSSSSPPAPPPLHTLHRLIMWACTTPPFRLPAPRTHPSPPDRGRGRGRRGCVPLSLPCTPRLSFVQPHQGCGSLRYHPNEFQLLTHGQQRWPWPVMRHEGAAAAPPRPTTLWTHPHRTRAPKAGAQRGRGGENQGPNHGLTPCSFRRLLPFLFLGFSAAWETRSRFSARPRLGLGLPHRSNTGVGGKYLLATTLPNGSWGP